MAWDSVLDKATCILSKLYHYAQTYGDLLLLGDPQGTMAEEAVKIGVLVLAPDNTTVVDAMAERV